MRHHSFMLKDALLTLSIPLGIKGICYSAKNPFSSLDSSDLYEDENPISWMRKLDNLLSAAFTDYIGFILMMLIFRLLVELMKTAYCYLISQTQTKSLCPQYNTYSSSFKNEEGVYWKLKGVIVFLCKLMTCFTILFGLCQFSSMMSKLIFDDAFLSRNDPVLFGSHNLNLSKFPQTQAYRNLDQLSNEEAIEERITSPNMNVGEILGSFPDWGGGRKQAAVLSKDGKILFVKFNNGLLEISDISNPKKRGKIGELAWNTIMAQESRMFLSVDEQTLFIQSMSYGCANVSIDIIDISNRGAPVLKSQLVVNGGPVRDSGFSTAISSDSSLLYSYRNGTFEIFNLSQPISPVLVYKKPIDLFTIIALSHDDSKIILSRAEKFEIFNVTDPSNPILISSGITPWKTPIQKAFSNDGKKLFVVWKDRKSANDSIFLQTFDMTNLTSPSLISSTSIDFLHSWTFPTNFWFDEERRFAFYFTKDEFQMIRLENLECTVLFTFKEDYNYFQRIFALSPDYQRSVFIIETQVISLRFNIDITTQSFAHLKPNALTVINERDDYRKPAIALSKDEKTLLLFQVSQRIGKVFLPFERVDKFSFQELKPIQIKDGPGGLDGEWSFLTGTQSMGLFHKAPFSPYPSSYGSLYFLSNRNSSPFSFQQSKPNGFIGSAAIAEDDKKIVFISSDREKGDTLNIISLQNETADYFLNFKIPNSPLVYLNSLTRISHDGNIVFCANNVLMIYDIRNPALPLIKSSYKLDFGETIGFTLSKDERMAYVVGINEDFYRGTKPKTKFMKIVDVSNIEYPKLLSSIIVNITESRDRTELSCDENILFIGFASGMMMIDVRIPTKPIPFGTTYFPNENNGLKLANNKSLFYTASFSGVKVFDISSQYILHFKNSDFKIGDSYSINLNVLKMNSNFKFDYIKKHKFLKASSFDNVSLSNKNLPLWITLDKERAVLRVEPKTASHAGNYRILVVLSTQTQASTFIGLKPIPTERDAKNLMLNLLQYGYIDTEGYISENFDPSQELWLDSNYESVEKEIKALLSQNYIQAIGEISVSPSLNLLETNPLTISALNKDHISVTIELDRNQMAKAINPYFLTKTYPNLKSTITNERSLLLLEGSLENINEGLKQILIDLNGLTFPQRGRITVADGINSPVSRFFYNISKYFNESMDPISLSQNRLRISGQANTANIIVSIHLLTQSPTTNAQQPYFVSKTFPFLRSSLTDNQKLLFLEGLPVDINQALQEIIIDLNGFNSCQGVVNFTDGVNPPKSKSFWGISTYFNQSKSAIDISRDNKLIISSFATNGIASIKLLSTNTIQRPYFMSKSYPFLRSSLTDQQTLLFLEGPLSDINSALREILIDLNTFSSCDGIVNFTDGVNPPKSRFFSNISTYLNISKDTISISQDKKLMISSLTTNVIVNIQLLSPSTTEKPYFISKSYSYLRSSLTDQQTLLFLEGPLSDINSAFREVVIDLNSLSSCSGIVNFTDGVNPPKSRFFSDISVYLNISKDAISISQDNKLFIYSLATHITVNIQLLVHISPQRPNFISKSYPYLRSSLTDQQTLLFLEGPLSDINSALREILIDLNTFSSCDGIVNFTDGVNPPKSRFISNISTYLNISNDAIFISQDNKLAISSLMTGHLIVTIQLFTQNKSTSSTERPYFISKSYPYLRSSLTGQQTLLFLEGPLEDINSALREVVIDLNEFSSCDGIVNLTDGVNPSKSRFFAGISTYLNISNDLISISRENKLLISSFATNVIVNIQLLSPSTTEKPHFISKSYPYLRSSLTDQQTLLFLEGPLSDVNTALREVVIDLNSLSFCSGIINLTDGVNLPKSRFFSDISNYLNIINNTISISQDNKLVISSFVTNVIVNIQLLTSSSTRRPYLISKSYPFIRSSLTDQQTLLFLEGSLSDVNSALREVMIELNTFSSCNGIVNFTDGVNLPKSRFFSDISIYFNQSKEAVDISQDQKLIISSFATDIIVNIQLLAPLSSLKPRFISKSHPYLRSSLADQQTSLFLEGPLSDINSAFREIIIDMNTLTSCDGIVNFTDGINPQKSRFFSNISNYFIRREAIAISEDNKLIIDSNALSAAFGSITIQLISMDTLERPNFISRPYPNLRSSLTGRQNILFLEGAFGYIYSALREIVIDLNTLPTCDGIVTINDGVNIPWSRFFFDISKYLEISKDAIFISEDNKLIVSSLTTNHLIVTIQLFIQNKSSSIEKPYFLSKSYTYLRSSLTDQQTLLFLEGPLEDINSALREVVIDLNTFSSCSGIVNLTDGVNPSKSRFFSDISVYLNISKNAISISEDNKLFISSFATNIIVNIQLLTPTSTEKPYFISRSYPYLRSSLTDQQTLLFLEGSLTDVNSALREVVIDLNAFSSCHGIVNFTDGVNPPKSRFFSNISTYLNISKDAISISQDNRFVISSLFPSHLTITIQLDLYQSAEHQAHFINKPYSFVRFTIANNKTMIYLEGSMRDINEVLKVIEVDHGKCEFSGGLVTVKDGINPPITKYFEDLTKYFSNHTAPLYNLNLSIQDQIDKRPFYTGLYQMVELHPATFIDKNGLSLEYSLEMEGSPHGLPPSWISFKGLNLMGTPPEKFSPLSYNFILKVKNEFKTTTIPFTLNVHISFVYAAKLIMTYVGYIVSFIGLRYSINKVYNLLAMKYYRYPRSFRLRVGEKITDHEIFPISFVKAERTKSKELFKALQKHVTQNYQSSLLEYFMESQILDKEKIISTLDELDHKYSSDFSRGVIEQLIINMIVTIQLAQKQEAETKKIFVKIKEKWMDLVFPSTVPSQFLLSQEKLQQELAEISPEFIQEKDLNESTLSTELLPLSSNEKINMDLLKNSILAHAFDRQNLDITSILTDVISYKKLKGTSLWHKLKKLLLKDLKPFVVLNKREIGYGIEYNIDDDTLFFSGQLTHDLQDNIIVIHIKNHRGRILRELWLTGENKDVKRLSIMDQISEPL